MTKDIVSHLLQTKYATKSPRLCKNLINEFSWSVINLLFPQTGSLSSGELSHTKKELESLIEKIRSHLKRILDCLHQEFEDESSLAIIDQFIDEFISIEEKLNLDAQFIYEQDPAAKSLDEVIICYPGFYAIAMYRIAHFFYQKNVFLLPRVLTEYAHQQTGIDIHPGAQIQAPFYIDHGTGVVIGESTHIAPKVKVYQGVTLGALSVERELRNTKRHPTIEENVIIYSNATILGGRTIIGKDSIIGGNVWITSSVEKNSQIYRVIDNSQQVHKKR